MRICVCREKHENIVKDACCKAISYTSNNEINAYVLR